MLCKLFYVPSCHKYTHCENKVIHFAGSLRKKIETINYAVWIENLCNLISVKKMRKTYHGLKVFFYEVTTMLMYSCHNIYIIFASKSIEICTALNHIFVSSIYFILQVLIIINTTVCNILVNAYNVNISKTLYKLIYSLVNPSHV